MRSTLVRSGAVAVAALALAAGTTAHAAAPTFKPVTITDPAGDANGINGQGTEDVPSTSTPSDYSGGDIVSIAWVTNGTKSKPTGFTVTMTLSGAPAKNTIYRVTTATADCSTFWLNYSDMVDGAITGSLQHNCPGFTGANPTSSSESVKLGDGVTVKDKTITWTVPASVIPSAVKPGTAITSLSGHTRFYAGTSISGGATVPQIDEAAGDGTYVYGK